MINENGAGIEPYIFISYAHVDLPRVKPLLTFFEQQGYPIWYDKGQQGHAIPAGQTWTEFVGEKAEHCTCFIAMYSKAYFASAFCFGELTIASMNHRHIIPVFVEDVQEPSKIIMLLGGSRQGMRWCDYDEDIAFFHGLEQDGVIRSFAPQPPADVNEARDNEPDDESNTLLPRVRQMIRDKELPPPVIPVGHDEDALLQDAVELALEGGEIYISRLQRRLQIGFARAARLMDRMQELGFIERRADMGPSKCLITREAWGARNKPDKSSLGMPELDGTELGDRFMLLEKAGRGENAVVYKAYDCYTWKNVALKLYDEWTAKSIPLLRKPELLEKLQTSNLILPSVIQATPAMPVPVRCGSIAPKGCSGYIAAEYIDGQTIAQMCEKDIMSASDAVCYLRRMMLSLDMLHVAGLRYGDLSPNNVMVDKQGKVFLVDSSCIDFIGEKSYFVTIGFEDGYQAGESFYSPEYAAEQACDERADVYSMGMMIKYLLIDHGDAMHFFNAIEKEKLLLVIEDATQRRPERRFAGIGELRQAFLDALPWKLKIGAHI